MLKCFIQLYPGQCLGVGVVQAEVEQGHLHVLHQDLAYGPISVAGDGRDELLGRLRSVRSLEVGEGKVWRARGLLQVAVRAQSIPQSVECASVVRLDERRAGECIDVREPDGKGWYVRQGDPGTLLDLLQPLAGDLVLFLWLVYEEPEKYQRNMHEVVGVQRDEREMTQRLPQRFETRVDPLRFSGDYEGGRRPVPLLPFRFLVPTELQT